ncbi:MAG: ScyD/ScyE family protein [Intrasporangiaceae bacterium]|nr:ScyD/ScyE family protein [Intrasporangiaceae bacterium]
MNSPNPVARRVRRAFVPLLGSIALVATMGAAPTANADAHLTVVASGLDNPRHLSVGPAGDLFVAEAGRGGDGPCFDGPEGGEVCFGLSGAITRVTAKGKQERVLTGLDENPIHDPDSNPGGFIRWGSDYIVADAGGNTLVEASKDGATRTLAVFEDQLAFAPPFLGLPEGTKIPSQSVPTSVVQGPGGALYVSELTGFPFEKGLAKIYKVDKRGNVSVYASGLTNVTDLAFGPGNVLYAVQLASNGLFAGPVGSVVAIPKGGGDGHTVVAEGLFAPYGIAIRGKMAYVTTGSVAAGGGQVVAIPLG